MSRHTIEVNEKPRRIWLRSFYGFNPEEDGYLGWTEEGPRNRMLNLIADGDLFMIYGAASDETAQQHRNQILGFLQVRASAMRDFEKASAAAMSEKKARGWQHKWTFAIPVERAWRVDERVMLETIAPKTYRPEAGRAIAAWSQSLLDEEIDLALKLRVTEVSVFGEPPLLKAALKNSRFVQAFQPSRAFPGSFGTRTSVYEDGPTLLYLARFEGDGFALLGQPKPLFDKTVLLKIGVSNDKDRRLSELNSGFPPACLGKWRFAVLSEAFDNRQAAEAAERAFKQNAETRLKSLGGEFFRGELASAEEIFAVIPGVARFGKR